MARLEFEAEEARVQVSRLEELLPTLIENHVQAWEREGKAWGPNSRGTPRNRPKWEKATEEVRAAFRSIERNLTTHTRLKERLRKLTAIEEVESAVGRAIAEAERRRGDG